MKIERKLSSLDCMLDGKSTLIMFQQPIKLRDVWSCTIGNKAITHEFVDHTLTIEYSNNIPSPG